MYGFGICASPVCLASEGTFRSSSSEQPVPPFIDLFNIDSQDKIKLLTPDPSWKKKKIPSFAILVPSLASIVVEFPEANPEEILFAFVALIQSKTSLVESQEDGVKEDTTPATPTCNLNSPEQETNSGNGDQEDSSSNSSDEDSTNASTPTKKRQKEVPSKFQRDLKLPKMIPKRPRYQTPIQIQRFSLRTLSALVQMTFPSSRMPSKTCLFYFEHGFTMRKLSGASQSHLKLRIK